MQNLTDYISQINQNKRYFIIKHKIKLVFSKVYNFSRGFSDFFTFPFDVSLPMPAHSKAALNSIIQFLDSNSIDYWVADGTLLGIYRDHELIRHDTDLDFYLKDANSVKQITEFLISHDFKIGRVMKKWGRIFQLSFYDERKLIIDFCIWYSSSNGYRYWVAPEIKGKRLQPEKFFVGTNRIHWDGTSFKTFSNIEEWLSLVYGNTWMVAETVKLDWRESVQDLEK